MLVSGSCLVRGLGSNSNALGSSTSAFWRCSDALIGGFLLGNTFCIYGRALILTWWQPRRRLFLLLILCFETSFGLCTHEYTSASGGEIIHESTGGVKHS